METFETEEQQNNRSEYPANRIVLDIFELLQDMASIGFVFNIGWRSECAGSPLLTVDVWSELNEKNCYGEAKQIGDIEPLVMSHSINNGWCAYSQTETESLHRLYDSLWDIYKKRKNETAIPDVIPF